MGKSNALFSLDTAILRLLWGPKQWTHPSGQMPQILQERSGGPTAGAARFLGTIATCNFAGSYSRC
jgi:hypothetical protein